MSSPSVHRRLLFPVVIVLSASFCFAAQEKGRAAQVETQSKQTTSKLAKAKTRVGSAVVRTFRRIRPHLGPVTLGTGYDYYSGPTALPLYYSYTYPMWNYYAYGPFWGSPLWGPAFYGYPPYSPALRGSAGEGHVRLRIDPATAEVLIDNAYAGTVAGLKGSIWLKPGAYDLLVKAPGYVAFSCRIYVLSGKKLEIDARLTRSGPGN